MTTQNFELLKKSAVTQIAQDLASQTQAQLNQWALDKSFTEIGDFTAGFTITERQQIALFNGEWYRWDGALPKVVAPGSTPVGTGGIAQGGWLSVGDAALRSGLADPNSAVPVGGVAAGKIAKRVSGWVTPEEFGAKADGLTDDTAAIQAAVNASDFVWFTSGKTYMAALIYIRAGMTLVGWGAEIKLLPNQSKFARLLTTQNNLLNQVNDSVPLRVMGLTLDGNRVNQGTYLGYELEQQMLLFLDAGNNNTGRLVAFVHGVNFKESCSDGISIYRGVDVSISHCHFWNCFRGSITPIGGWSKIKFNNITAGGDVHKSFINIEPDAGGGGTGDYSLTMVGSDSVFEGTLDVGMKQSGGSILLSNIEFKGIGLNIIGSSASNTLDFRAVNCVFNVQTAANSFLQHPNKVTFDNCVFKHIENSSAISYIQVNWGGTVKNQKVTFNNCNHIHVGAGAFSTFAAVYVESGAVSDNNVIEFNKGAVGDGSAIGDHFTYAAVMANGGSVKIDGTFIGADYIAQASNSIGNNYSLHLGQVELGANNIGLGFFNSVASGNVLRFDNTVIQQSKNIIDTSFGWGTGFTVLGNRIIQGSSAPTSSTVAFTGDQYKLDAPIAGSAFEWVALNSSYGAALWKVSKSLSA